MNDIRHNHKIVAKKQLVSVEPDDSQQQCQPNKDGSQEIKESNAVTAKSM